MAREPALVTYEDYVHLPPDRRWEVIEGVAHVVPAPNTRHQTIVVGLVTVIRTYVDAHGGGKVFVAPFDAVLTEIDIFQPDIVFITDADLAVLTDANVRGNPTWVIEVLSNPYYERDKFRRYEAAGVPEYWLMNPYEDTLDISIFDGSAYTPADRFGPPDVVHPRCLPDLRIDLSYILRR